MAEANWYGESPPSMEPFRCHPSGRDPCFFGAITGNILGKVSLSISWPWNFWFSVKWRPEKNGAHQTSWRRRKKHLDLTVEKRSGKYGNFNIFPCPCFLAFQVNGKAPLCCSAGALYLDEEPASPSYNLWKSKLPVSDWTCFWSVISFNHF